MIFPVKATEYVDCFSGHLMSLDFNVLIGNIRANLHLGCFCFRCSEQRNRVKISRKIRLFICCRISRDPELEPSQLGLEVFQQLFRVMFLPNANNMHYSKLRLWQLHTAPFVLIKAVTTDSFPVDFTLFI